MSPTTQADVLTRYARLIEDLLAGGSPFSIENERDGTINVERAGVLEIAGQEMLLETAFALVGRLDLPAASARLTKIVDRSGNARSHYRGLLVYGFACAFPKIVRAASPDVRGRWERVLHAWCGVLQDDISYTDPGTAGSAAASWAGLALFVAGEALGAGTWSASGAAVMTRLTVQRQSAGALLPAHSSEHPETAWFHELVTLHALAAYAARTNAPAVQQAVEQAALFQLNEVQPDHATSEPWGLIAFVRNPDAGSLADQLLHTVRVLQPAGPTGVTRILLADTLQYLKPLA